MLGASFCRIAPMQAPCPGVSWQHPPWRADEAPQRESEARMLLLLCIIALVTVVVGYGVAYLISTRCSLL